MNYNMELETDYTYFKENTQNLSNYQQPRLTNPRQSASEDEEVDIPIIAQPHVTPRTWYSLCHIELESIGLSIFVPFHVVGKVGESLGYTYALFYYIYLFLYIILYYIFYVYSQLSLDNCSFKETDNCFSETEENCITKYVSDNHAFYSCSYNQEYQICYPKNQECLEEEERTYLIAAVILLNLISVGGICGINVFLRKSFKEQQLVKYNKCTDPFIAIFLMPLSLAQQYKDIGVTPTSDFTSIQI